jgi:uncharacterized surface protein with fasciclin (FAS1) repeats
MNLKNIIPLCATAIPVAAILFMGFSTHEADSAPVEASSSRPNIAVKMQHSKSKTYAQMAKSRNGFAQTALALQSPALAQRIEGISPYTVFAPNDSSVSYMLDRDVPDATQDGRASYTANVLMGHIVPGYMTVKQLNQDIAKSPSGEITLQTLSDAILTIRRQGSRLLVTSSKGGQLYIANGQATGTHGALLFGEGILATEIKTITQI